MGAYPLLETVGDPADLRAFDRKQLAQLATELRAFIVDSVAATGGHLSSNLGTVELTIALHYVFQTPEDRVIWDVGHQTYGHKILTGRREGMRRLRQKGGIAGFPRREESPYDAFGTAHSSTSISAALGMAVAAKRLGAARNVVAVIGDGALTGGMAFEALNNAEQTRAKVIVVLNDNDMSISENVGALNNYLSKLMSGRFYAATRSTTKKVLSTIAPQPVQQLAKRFEEHAKGMLTPSTMFEEFGFNYTGPVDGHNLDVLIETLGNVKRLDGAQFLHVVTRKGHGYAYAEEDPIAYHGPGKFDPGVGIVRAKPVDARPKPTYTQVFGEWLCDMARLDSRLVGITPAMREGSGLVRFSQEFPDRYFDVGIAEQHAVTFAAGLAVDGMKPVVAIYSTFLQRGYDQLIHDVALQKLPVLFAIDRAGLVGPDGATHNGGLDLSYLRCVPGLTLMAPADGEELRNMLHTGIGLGGPAAVRYPRALTAAPAPGAPLVTLPHAASEVRRNGGRTAILAFGTLLATAMDVGEEIDATVVNMRFVKPLDARRVAELARGHELLVTLEESALAGGAGAAVTECLAARGLAVPVLNLGLPDVFIEHGTREEALADARLDRASVLAAIEARRAQIEPEAETGRRRPFGSFALGSARLR